MIYDPVTPDSPIRQGDIFSSVALPDYSLKSVIKYGIDGTTEQVDLSRSELAGDMSAVVVLRRLAVIVISQDCDCARGDYISVAPIVPLVSTIGNGQEPKTPKSWASFITKNAKDKLRYFYLPQDGAGLISERSVADYRAVTRVLLNDMQDFRSNRRLRLNEVAGDHFKEQLAHFFRRYAYNEWYPLDRGELEAYKGQKNEQIPAYPWQE